MHWCFHCYGLNNEPCGTCIHCGESIQRPPGLSYNDQLIWTLDHPDGDRAVLAARTLGRQHVDAALPALRRAVNARRDPYLASAALRSAIEIAGADELRPWLQELSHCDAFMLSTIAQRALAEDSQAATLRGW